MELPRLIGHRGAAACAPENTLAGLRKAAELGLRWVEFDVRLTRDGDLVLFHDEKLARTTNGRGRVASLTRAELETLDAGSWFGPEFAGEPVPALADALALLRALDLAANIEIKTTHAAARASAAALARILDRHWPGAAPPRLVSSFERRVLEAVREIAPRWPLALLVKTIEPGWLDAARALECRMVNCGDRGLVSAHVDAVKSAGYPMAVFTVNDPARARQLFAWGVDAVFTDSPDRLAAALG